MINDLNVCTNLSRPLRHIRNIIASDCITKKSKVQNKVKETRRIEQQLISCFICGADRSLVRPFVLTTIERSTREEEKQQIANSNDEEKNMTPALNQLFGGR